MSLPDVQHTQTATGLTIDRVSKQFGRFPALREVSLEVAPGELLALLGPSGSGKTTLLRTIAGLEPPDSGSVNIDDADFLALSPRERRVGMVFQHYALFRHMTVAANVGFGLKVRPRRERPARAEIDAKVEQLLKLVQLEGLGRRYPAQLSGGQRQRVALARALAIEPRLLLLDEPFGALDAKVRLELRTWLKALHRTTGVTTLFVTHDQEEAMQVADRIAILRDGRIEQVGTPAELEAEPASAFVFDFLGASNPLPCRVAGGVADADGLTVPVINPHGVSGEAIGRFRPYDAVLLREGAGLPVTVSSVARRGATDAIMAVDEAGHLFAVESPRGAVHAQPGERLMLRPTRLFVFAERD